jgi:signal transduction histidine kinase
MDESQSQTFLKSERQNTDDSLNAERDKTNESLNDVRTKAENKTDSVVNKERLLADRLTTSSRSAADTGRGRKRKSLGLDGKAIRDAEQLHNERRSQDQVTEQERTRTDAALGKERATKDALVNQFLEQEREKTDENLSVERTRTDSEVQEHSILLSAEIAEHLKTKTSLTSRDEFLAIVSHDLKNPIGAASSCAEMLLEDAAYKGLDPEVRTWIQFIKRNNDTALRLINDLLEMEQVAEGKLQLKVGRHDIGRIIRESIESHAQLASSKSILLRLMPSDISGEVICDRDRITQVLSNLVGNAIKFTPEGGSITINANFSESELRVCVRDTGPGIPDNMKDKVFERFVQLASNDRRGLGLGLHISKMLIEAHLGRIWVQSKAGEGSTFFFALPRLNSISQLGLQ